MTNEEKFEAIKRGDAGSYNLAPRNGSDAERAIFQSKAREMQKIASERGYFCRAETRGEDDALEALLVTIPQG